MLRFGLAHSGFWTRDRDGTLKFSLIICQINQFWSRKIGQIFPNLCTYISSPRDSFSVLRFALSIGPFNSCIALINFPNQDTHSCLSELVMVTQCVPPIMEFNRVRCAAQVGAQHSDCSMSFHSPLALFSVNKCSLRFGYSDSLRSPTLNVTRIAGSPPDVLSLGCAIIAFGVPSKSPPFYVSPSLLNFF